MQFLFDIEHYRVYKNGAVYYLFNPAKSKIHKTLTFSKLAKLCSKEIERLKPFKYAINGHTNKRTGLYLDSLYEKKKFGGFGGMQYSMAQTAKRSYSNNFPKIVQFLTTGKIFD